jgi:hypothetical protein
MATTIPVGGGFTPDGTPASDLNAPIDPSTDIELVQTSTGSSTANNHAASEVPGFTSPSINSQTLPLPVLLRREVIVKRGKIRPLVYLQRIWAALLYFWRNRNYIQLWPGIPIRRLMHWLVHLLFESDTLECSRLSEEDELKIQRCFWNNAVASKDSEAYFKCVRLVCE